MARGRTPNTIQFGVPAERVFVEERLRTALRGLAAGVLALHEAGVLHRDLKLLNVLVDADGRVVILDFGLVATGVVNVHQSYDGPWWDARVHVARAGRGRAAHGRERLLFPWRHDLRGAHGASAVLGLIGDVLRARAQSPPRDPRSVARGPLPDDLVELAMELLAVRPEERPAGGALARRLGLAPSVAAEPSTRGPARVLVGRRRELETLAAARDARAQPVFVHVHGPPGIGKTALVRHFLSELDDAVVLEGRCYQRESVPYKALDPIVDALGRYLKRLPHLEAAGLLPRDSRALLRLFPTLGQLELMATLPGRYAVPDPHELRRRAFGALRELLARISDVKRVVIGHRRRAVGRRRQRGAARRFLALPDPPPVMLVLTYRTTTSSSGSGSSGSEEILAALRRSSPATVSRADVDLSLGPLAPEEAQELARALLGAEAAAGAPAVARESAGSPLFIGQLSRELSAGRRSGNLSLQRMLANRVAAVSDDARVVLEVLACAASPQEEEVLAAASGFGAPRVRDALELLQKEHLVGVTGPVEQRVAQILHEELRAAAHASLPPERARALHVSLAEHHERAGTGDRRGARRALPRGRPRGPRRAPRRARG